MREVLPFLNLLKEIHEVFPLEKPKNPEFFCCVWEDNCSCIKVAEHPNFTPHKKHITLKYHHFRQFNRNKTFWINPIDTREQIADNLYEKVQCKECCGLIDKNEINGVSFNVALKG